MEDSISTAVNDAPASTGPTTFAEAFAADASPASGTPDPSQTNATAAEQPATGQEASPQQGDERSPFIPRARFDEVNTKLNELKQWREQHAWVESIDRQALEQAQQIGQMYSQDRAGYIRQLLSEAIADPQLAPAIRSEAARLLGSRQQAAEPQEPQPDLPIQLEDGRVVHLYSAEQQAKREAWLQQQWMGKVQEQMAPAMSAAERLQQAEQMAQRVAAANQFAGGFAGDLQKLPHFADLKDEIRTRLASTHLASDHPAEVKAAAYAIYTQVLAEKVLPSLSQKAQSQLLDNLQAKAAASTSVNPGTAAPTSPRKITSFNDPALQW